MNNEQPYCEFCNDAMASDEPSKPDGFDNSINWFEEYRKLHRKHVNLKAALLMISESCVAWKDEQANMLLESVGNIANKAIDRDEEGL